MTGSGDCSVKIIVGGDVCPVRRNEALFCAGSAQEILGDLLPAWQNADFRLVNLECPLIASPAPIKKTGPHLSAQERTINGLKALGIDVVGIANNHIRDHGADGVLNTIRLCRENGIAVVGGGANLAEAREPLICEIKGLRLGIIAMADLEWSTAGLDSAGANPFLMSGFLKTMRYLRGKCDHILALLHLGKEHYPYPSPELQDTCRCLADEGVSVVICQHSHCAGACEHYNGRFVCYGQGNLIFDSPKSKMESWRSGYLLEIVLTPGSPPAIKARPYDQRQDGRGVEPMGSCEAEEFHDRMKIMEIEIQDMNFVGRKWVEFCREKRDLYFSILAGHGRCHRKFNQLTGLTRYMYSSDAVAILENVVRCKAHLEVLQSILCDFRTERWNRMK